MNEDQELEQPIESKQVFYLRALVIGVLLIPFNCYWLAAAELRWYVMLTLNPLFITPIFYLFILALANMALRRFLPKYVLKPAELVIIYVMLVVSCTLCTQDYLRNLVQAIPFPRWFATAENRWETDMFHHLPQWLLVWDKKLLEGYFRGDSSLTPSVIRMWFLPLAFWSIFIITCGWIMLCMSTLLRKSWSDYTKLSYPIVRLPFALTENPHPGAALRSPILWAGFALAAGISANNQLHQWFPMIREIQVRAQPIGFSNPPLSALGGAALTLYPFSIGLAFLLPLDVSFSCWFFFLLFRLQALVGYQMGYGNVQDFPYVHEQAIGGWTAFGLLLLYSSRNHLKEAVRVALRPDGSDKDEPMSYRIAFWGLLIGCAIFFVFWLEAGMSPGWVLFSLGAYMLTSIVITRIRAEAGGQHTFADLEPAGFMRLFDSNTVGSNNLAAGALNHWYWRYNRSHMMPNQLEGFKLGQDNKMNLRSLVLPIMIAMVVATIFGMWAYLYVSYTEGASARCLGFTTGAGNEAFGPLGSALKDGYKTEAGKWGVVASAALFVGFLSYMRASYSSFPFHPLGYCIAPGLVWHWMPFFVAWVIKFTILRYGGLRTYRQVLPFFLGLILGDYVAAALWSLIGVIFHMPAYQAFH
ncbi:MAG: DUF6785 family protein [bacterium]